VVIGDGGHHGLGFYPLDADGEEEAIQGRGDHKDGFTMKPELAADIDFNNEL
jgi:hypothetical protein